jgi:hypothetical protein
MAHTVTDRQLQKIGRYSKELIKVTFTSTSNTPASLDTRLNVPLYGTMHTNFDQAGTAVTAAVIIANNAVTLSNRSGAFLNGQVVVIELMGY